MYGIDILVEEHKNILKFVAYVKNMCCDVLEGKDLKTQSFRDCIDFGRNYADKHHHAKEEKILFRIMLEKLGLPAEKLIRSGMLVEHALGRFHLRQLEEALDKYDREPKTETKLDIISNAAGYAALLIRHIDKEDAAAYTFAERMLSDEDKKRVDDETKQFESDSEEIELNKKYMNWLNSIL